MACLPPAERLRFGPLVTGGEDCFAASAAFAACLESSASNLLCKIATSCRVATRRSEAKIQVRLLAVGATLQLTGAGVRKGELAGREF